MTSPVSPYIPNYLTKEAKGIYEERKKDKSLGFFDVLPSAISNSLFSSNVVRYVKRGLEDSEVVHGYTPTTQELEPYVTKFLPTEMDHIKQASSPEGFKARVRHVEEDRVRHSIVGRGGVKGVLAELAVLVFDPAAIGTGYLTAGVAGTMKASRLIRTLSSGTAVGLESVMFDSMQAASDTQRGANDLLFTAGIGAGVGGVIGFFSRGRKALNNLDKSLNTETKQFLQESNTLESMIKTKQMTTRAFENFKNGDGRLSDFSRKEVRKALIRLDDDFTSLSSAVVGEPLVKIQKNKKLLVDMLYADDMWYKKNFGVTRFHLRNTIEGYKAAWQKIVDSRLTPKQMKTLMHTRNNLAVKLKGLKSTARAVLEYSTEPKKFRDLATKLARLKKGSKRYIEIQDRMKQVGETFRVSEFEDTTRRLNDVDDKIKMHNLNTKKVRKDAQTELNEFDGLEFYDQVKIVMPDAVRLSESIKAITMAQIKSVNAASDEVLASSASKISRIENAKAGKVSKVDSELEFELDIETSPGKGSVAKEADEVSFTIESDVAKVEREGDISNRQLLNDKMQDGTYEPVALQFKMLPKFVQDLPLIKKLLPEGSLLPRWFRDRAQSLFTTLDGSANQAVRALNRLFFEAPQGNFSPESTVSILSFLNLNEVQFAARARYENGYVKWSRANGRGIVRAYVDAGNNRSLFNKQVFLKLTNPKMEVDEGVQVAFEGMRDQLSKALELRRSAGEQGFEDVLDNIHGYAPILFSNQKADKYSDEFLMRLISKGYQTGGYELTKESADRLASLRVSMLNDSTIGYKAAARRILTPDQESRLLSELKDKGVSSDVLETFMVEKDTRALLQNVSNRAKASMRINTSAKIGDVSVADILETNVSQIVEVYSREAAAGAAMAEKGIRSYDQARRLVELATSGMKGKVDPKRLKIEEQMLMDGVDMLYGKSIEVDPAGFGRTSLRRVREITAVDRLGQMGFAQFPETARALVNVGISEVLRNVPGTAIFRRQAARVGGVSSGDLNEPLLREIEYIFGYVGEHNWHPLNVREDDIATGLANNNFTRVLDNVIAASGKVNMVASGFQAVQGGLEKVVMKSIAYKLLQAAGGGKNFTKTALREIGWSEDFMDSMLKFLKENPKYAEYNGKQVRLMNFDNMPKVLRRQYQVGASRFASRLVQRNFVGETSTWMSSTLGKTLSQFRRFQIVSLEKQLIHDLRGDKVAAAQILLWSSFLGLMAYGSQTYLNSIGEKDPGKYLKKRLNLEAISYGVFNKMPQPASLQLGGDALTTLGLMPKDVTAGSGRLGFRQMGANYIPSVGTGADALNVIRGTMSLLRGDASKEDALRTAHTARKLIPTGNAIGIGNVFKGVINKSLE